ncbi:MAG: glycosyltransferase family 2 protein [Candidatus Omnitrophica bacterium]|nr:glycosyltransferase family 2 protein [Candidatus Omnitrophota bacterium]
MENNLQLSIIIPVFNEQGNLKILAGQIHPVMDSLALSYEIIFIDDGSTDNSAAELEQIAKADKHARVITLLRNYGQTQAIAAGVDHALGQLIITMDADLQNDPKDIPKLLNKLNQGYDVVSGWRINRKDNFWQKKLPSLIANFISARLTKVKLHDLGCTLKAYKIAVLKDIEFQGEIHRFLPLCAAIQGAKIAEVTVSHHKRKHGHSKYGVSRFFKVILDMLTILFTWKFMAKPIHVFGGIGIISVLFSVFIGVFIVLRKVLWAGQWVSPLLFLFVLFFIIGIQFILIGILAEIVIRLYSGMRDHSSYRIKPENKEKV